MPQKEIQCPLCQETMQKRMVEGQFEIDYCDRHGIWLDAGEFEALVARMQENPAESNRKSGGESGGSSLLSEVGRRLGHSALFGAGATVGHRLVGGILDSIFRR